MPKEHAYTICITYQKEIFIQSLKSYSNLYNIKAEIFVSGFMIFGVLVVSALMSFRGAHILIRPVRELNIRM